MQRQSLYNLAKPYTATSNHVLLSASFSEPGLSILFSVSLSSLESFILKRGKKTFLFSIYPGLGTFLDEITSFILWTLHSSREGTPKASSVRSIRWSLCWSTGKINKIKQARPSAGLGRWGKGATILKWSWGVRVETATSEFRPREMRETTWKVFMWRSSWE